MKNKILTILCVVLAAVLVLTAFVVIPLKEDNSSDTEKLIQVKELCQYPDLPTGCEATCASMVLNYYGVDITPQGFAGSWLEYNNDFEYIDDKLYGPDPKEFFVGDPFDKYSYGCYAPAIAKAVNDNSVLCDAEVIYGKTVDQLCTKYIDNDKPLILWVTTSMRESKVEASWYLEDDSCFYWKNGEHAMVLVGYDEIYYFLNDPESGSTVAYRKDVVEKRFAELGRQAVYIDTK